MESDNEETIAMARRVIAHADERGLPVRVLGGVAIAMQCPAAQEPALARRYADLDLVTTAKSAYTVGELLQELGFAPEERFNQLHGRSRLLFASTACHLDVLVDKLVMCHTLELAKRIEVIDGTLPLADLLLSKLQIVNLNDKDVRDIVAILADHDLTDGERGINTSYISNILGSDWGWWRTVTTTMLTVKGRLNGLGLPPEQLTRVATRLDALGELSETCQKSMRWRARSRIGERVPWYNNPEEVDE
jgi:hypothetical protein